MAPSVSHQADLSPVLVSFRRNSWFLMATFFLWLLTFVLLTPLLGPGGPPPTPQSAAEAVAQYADSGVGLLLINLLGAVATLVGIIPIVRISRQLRAMRLGRVARLGEILALAAFAVLLFHIYLRSGLIFAKPPHYPPLVDRVELYATNWLSGVANALWAFALSALGAGLARNRILVVVGWISAGLGVLFGALILITNLGFPLIPAFLSLVLGIALLRRPA